ncbi:MAG: acyl-CoA thioesterase [Cellvibrionaceae bacterium]
MAKSKEHLSESIEIKVPFHDVDLMGIAWHGHYVKYFEIARCALFDKLDYNYQQMKESGYAWPVIDLRIRYPNSIVFGQTVIVTATVVEWENRLKVDYEIRDQDGKKTTKGYTVQVAVDMSKNDMCMESPKILLEKLDVLND